MSDGRHVGRSPSSHNSLVGAESTRQGVGTGHASSNFAASHYES